MQTIGLHSDLTGSAAKRSTVEATKFFSRLSDMLFISTHVIEFMINSISLAIFSGNGAKGIIVSVQQKWQKTFPLD